MRYAIAKDGDVVSAHFGRCPEYLLVDVENSKITKEQIVMNPGHEPGAIPHFLKLHKADVVIAGGMGQRAIQFFKELEMDVMVGVSGEIATIKKNLAEGTLKSGESTCDPKSGRGYGLDRQGGCHHD
ncbi:MAG: NifB/NifX family molybdenum-iron cluster-binding protein [Candidatus Omnitrophota bacterium]